MPDTLEILRGILPEVWCADKRNLFIFILCPFFAVREELHILFLVFDTDLPEQNIKASCLSIESSVI